MDANNKTVPWTNYYIRDLQITLSSVLICLLVCVLLEATTQFITIIKKGYYFYSYHTAILVLSMFLAVSRIVTTSFLLAEFFSMTDSFIAELILFSIPIIFQLGIFICLTIYYLKVCLSYAIMSYPWSFLQSFVLALFTLNIIAVIFYSYLRAYTDFDVYLVDIIRVSSESIIYIASPIFLIFAVKRLSKYISDYPDMALEPLATRKVQFGVNIIFFMGIFRICQAVYYLVSRIVKFQADRNVIVEISIITYFIRALLFEVVPTSAVLILFHIKLDSSLFLSCFKQTTDINDQYNFPTDGSRVYDKFYTQPELDINSCGSANIINENVIQDVNTMARLHILSKRKLMMAESFRDSLIPPNVTKVNSYGSNGNSRITETSSQFTENSMQYKVNMFSPNLQGHIFNEQHSQLESMSLHNNDVDNMAMNLQPDKMRLWAMKNNLKYYNLNQPIESFNHHLQTPDTFKTSRTINNMQQQQHQPVMKKTSMSYSQIFEQSVN